MLRRISTKWVLTVLAAVIVPFLGYAWYLDKQMAQRQWDVVRYYLLSLASDMAERLDNEVKEREFDVEALAENPVTDWATASYDGEEVKFRPMLRGGFDHFIERSSFYDLVIAVDAQGHLVVSNTRSPLHQDLEPEYLEMLRNRDYSKETWFEKAMKGQVYLVDHHLSDLVPRRNHAATPHPENYHIGFAAPVRSQIDREQVEGVVYGLVNWSHIQTQILHPSLLKVRDLPTSHIFTSCYFWLWEPDADTIVAHKNTNLYTQKVSGARVNLPQLVEAARSSDLGFYPEYTFQGVRKNAAYKHCAGRENGGFGWVVGVGIDNDDVTVTIDELRDLLIKATLVVLGIVVFGTVLIARRTTAPILALQQHTKRIAAGDLDTPVATRTKDELGDLGRAFNTMTKELRESREKLIKAEKDAAWREMARQVAHEIKNPLTPISLSATLLKRAKDENSPEFGAIFDRTIDMITRQVENMRAIASDFSAFAGARRPEPGIVDVGPLVDEVLAMNAAWCAESSVVIERIGGSGRVFADRSELRRVLINLVSNAIEAMPQGGRLQVDVACQTVEVAPMVRIEVRDDGVGITDTVRARLFEPYFTTRTHGTGLGLAIAARLVDEMNGRIELVSVPEAAGKGTVARVLLPEYRG